MLVFSSKLSYGLEDRKMEDKEADKEWLMIVIGVNE